MTYTAQGIRASVLIHALFLLFVMVLSSMTVPERTRIVLDMGLLRSPDADGKPASIVKRTVPKPAVQPQEVSPTAVPSVDQKEPVVKEPPVQNMSQTRTGGGPSEADGIRNQYLSEYFAYIRDRIVKNLTFPDAARKMGWTGRVTVSFVICRDGHVENIRIVQSTGFEVLDRNVVDVIKRVSPFPRAPVDAELTIPIVYKLL